MTSGDKNAPLVLLLERFVLDRRECGEHDRSCLKPAICTRMSSWARSDLFRHSRGDRVSAVQSLDDPNEPGVVHDLRSLWVVITDVASRT